MKLVIGIDPGKITGFAVWVPSSKDFIQIKSCSIVEAMQLCLLYNTPETDCSEQYEVEIWFEDARKRSWFGKRSYEKMQGAGSIKRDCNIWQEFCEYYGFKYRAVPPQKGMTKTKAETFKQITGWKYRTNEHARDAALIVFQAK